MSLIVRIITSKGNFHNTGLFVKSFMDLLGVNDTPKDIKSSEYWKMPGHTEILFEIYGIFDFKNLVKKIGTKPVFLSEKEAIFDTSQDSSIYIKSVYWVHLEVIDNE